jgi:ribosome-associated protein
LSEPLTCGPVTIPASDLDWTAVRASGPGGQNVNKVASKIVLRFDLKGTRALDEETKARLTRIAGSRVDKDGALIVTSQKTRDQPLNLIDARAKLASLILQALVRETPRRPTKPTRSSKRRRLDEKRKHSEKKSQRRDYD